jgi:hypothetical protein
MDKKEQIESKADPENIALVGRRSKKSARDAVVPVQGSQSAWGAI